MKRVLEPGTRETVELTRAGAMVRIAVYRFTLDGLGPFEHRVPVDEDTQEKLIEAVERKEKILKAGGLEVSPEAGEVV